nr:hypothetical protein [Dietzia sp. SLG310A2-38A2]
MATSGIEEWPDPTGLTDRPCSRARRTADTTSALSLARIRDRGVNSTLPDQLVNFSDSM